MAGHAGNGDGMSTGGSGAQSRLDGIENARFLLDRWAESLAQVLESMTDQRPEVRWEAVSGPLSEVGGAQDFLWWEQPFPIDPQAAVWIAAPQITWEYAGTLTLRAAGLETVETAEAKNTWFEILGQSLAVMARSIGTLLHREVTTENGGERAASQNLTEWASVALTFAPPEAPPVAPPLLLAFSPALLALIAAPPAEAEAPAGASVPKADSAGEIRPAVYSRTMDLLLDVDLPVSISFGKALLPMKDVLKLTTGSIVELNRGLNEPVEVMVNHCLIARGEVVVVEGNYGVRIQEIASRQDRLRSLR
jgi:flagellar motor switch protein FliN/FliY